MLSLRMRFLARGLECLLGNIRTSRAWKRKNYETTWPRWSLSLKNAAQLNQVVTDMVEGIAAETVSDDDKNDFRRFQTIKMGTYRKNKQKIDRKFFAAKFQVITEDCWRIDLILYNYSRGETKCRCQCQWRCGEIKEAERSTLTTPHKNGLLHALSEFMWMGEQNSQDFPGQWLHLVVCWTKPIPIKKYKQLNCQKVHLLTSCNCHCTEGGQHSINAADERTAAQD